MNGNSLSLVLSLWHNIQSLIALNTLQPTHSLTHTIPSEMDKPSEKNEENKSLYYILIIEHKSIYNKLNDCYTLWISNLVNSIMSLRASYTHYEFSFREILRVLLLFD